MNTGLIVSSLKAFHINAVNGLRYNFATNWYLILLVVAAVISVVLSVKEQSASVVHEEQNIL